MMFGRGKGMGGGGANMLRTVGRAVARAGVTSGNPTTFQEPLPSTPSSPTSASQRHNNSNGYLSISSGSSAFGSCNSGVPISANSGLPTNWPAFAATTNSGCDEFEWVSFDGSEEDDKPIGVFDDFVLGPVPSTGEVQNVVSALQRSVFFFEFRDMKGIYVFFLFFYTHEFTFLLFLYFKLIT